MPARRFTPRAIVERLLSRADVRLDARRPWDLAVKDEAFYRRVLADGSLGLGEAYMDGWWDCEALDQFGDRILRAKLDETTGRYWLRRLVTAVAFARRWWGTAAAGPSHYDLGNDLYRAMLDRRMVYSCGSWRHASTLDDAQDAKLDTICRKIALQPGMTVLDIGCGWAGFGIYAAERYGAKVIGVTTSTEQAALGRERAAHLPVEIRLQDYRDLDVRADRIVSLGMFEHVRRTHDVLFMRVASRCLHGEGIVLLQTICRNAGARALDPWVNRYIFPKSVLPSLARIARAAESVFTIEDVENLGPDYDTTLLAWNRNFQRAWPALEARYGPRFKRMWEYWLLMSAGAFRSRTLQVLQLVMTPPGRRQPACLRAG